MFREPNNDPRKWFISHDIRLGDSSIPGAGTGVFAVNDIPARTIIEKCPVVLVGIEIFDHINDFNGERNVLCDYPFGWSNGLCAFALGWGGIYNHSFEANVRWRPHEETGEESLVYMTKRDIKAGEELFVRYCWSADKLWFVDESVDMGNNPVPGSRRTTMGLETTALFNDMRRMISAEGRGKNIETLSDYQVVSRQLKTEKKKDDVGDKPKNASMNIKKSEE